MVLIQAILVLKVSTQKALKIVPIADGFKYDPSSDDSVSWDATQRRQVNF